MPPYFQSDEEEDGEFWGFPMHYAELDIFSHLKINYTLEPRAVALFQEHQNEGEQEFKGFTRHDV